MQQRQLVTHETWDDFLVTLPLFVGLQTLSASLPLPHSWQVIGGGATQTPSGNQVSLWSPHNKGFSPINIIFSGNFSTLTFLNFHLKTRQRS